MGPTETKTSIEAYAAGKSWLWYLPLWLFGLYAYVQLFHFNIVKGQMPFVTMVPYSFDFFLHEMAHIVTAFLPQVLCAAAGSLSELLLGTALVVTAIKQRSYFASLFCFLWLDLACQSAGTYMADAVPQRLPLVSLGAMISGGEPKHDWHFVFGQLHLLGASALTGNTVRVLGTLVGTFGVVFAAYLLYKMSRAPRWEDSKDQTKFHALYPEGRPAAVKSAKDDGFTSLPLSYHTPNATAAEKQSNNDADNT